MKKRFLISFVLVGFIFSGLTFANDLDTLITNCNDCHGKDGVSTENDIPIIAGQSSIVLEDALISFAANERACKESEYRQGDITRPKTTMCHIAADLTDEQIEALSEHYAELTFVGVKQDFDATLIERGAKVHERNCEKCHSEGGSLADDDAGLLAGQWTPYLRTTIDDFLTDKTPMSDKMSVKLKGLKEEDLKALLSFYASEVK